MLKLNLLNPIGILTLVAIASTIASAAESGVIPAQASDKTLLSFDGTVPPEVKPAGAALKLVPNPGSIGGKQALEVGLSSKSETSGVVIQPAKPWDFSSAGDVSLAIDIANPGKRSVQLFSEVTNVAGVSQVRSSPIPADGRTVTSYIVLKGQGVAVETGIRQPPPGFASNGQQFIWMWGADKADITRIAKLSLYSEQLLDDSTIVISGVRMIQNPPADPDYLAGICDKFGQNAKVEFPIKVHSDEELKAKADAEIAALAKSQPMADRSKWGGWKNGPKRKATGFFRTEKVNGKWWLVDPDGHLFFSTGIANVRMANTATVTGVDFKAPTVREIDPEDVTPEDSKGFLQTTAEARETRFIASGLRHKMFQWLPEYGGPLDGHYSYERSVHKGAVPHGESFSFYEANLERRYGETSPKSYLTTWRDVTVSRMLDWGFTSFGNWVDPMFYHVDRFPYFANGWIIGNFKTVKTGFDYWSPLADPYDPEFKRRAKMTVQAIAEEVKGSPWCVGVFVDNEKGWGKDGSFESRFGLVNGALELDASESPAKTAFTGMMKEKYGSISALNKAWETSLGSWDDFGKSLVVKARNASVSEDFQVMAQAFCDEYFRTVHDDLEAVMPNHLYMGVRMASWGLTPETRESCKKFTDVVSYNNYKPGLWPGAWDFLKELDMPSIVGEFHMGAISDTGMFHPGLIMAADQKDRARMYQDYMKTVIDNPYFVGAHWFQYTDSPLTGRSFDGECYNIGFVSNTDIPSPEMVEAAKELNRDLYPRRHDGSPKEKP